MIKYITRYPDGRAGYALLLLRISYAIAGFGVAGSLAAGRAGAGFLCAAAGLAAISLVIGFGTRLIAVLLCFAGIIALLTSPMVQQLILAGHIGGCVAIALFGAGAYSVDAQRYGRRVIELKSSAPDRGADD